MATTAVGNPYVESSDLVANYPGVSETLAERLDVVGVNPFADAAARTTAIPSPTEGQMSSLSDTDSVERYDGSAWVAVGAAGGKILQVVQATTTTDTTINTTTYTDTTLTATITPTLATSKVLVMVNQNYKFSIASNYTALGYKIFRDATAIFTTPSLNEFGLIQVNGATTVSVANYTTVNYLDSPSTTSAVVYKTQSACANPGSLRMQHIGATSVIILMEVAA